MNPICCGKESKLVEPTLNLSYYYCEVCKKEVQSTTALELPKDMTLDEQEKALVDALKELNKMYSNLEIDYIDNGFGMTHLVQFIEEDQLKDIICKLRNAHASRIYKHRNSNRWYLWMSTSKRIKD